MYFTHYFSQRMGLKTQGAFIHLPLAPSQLIDSESSGTCLPSTAAAQAIRIVLEQLT
jgi:pyrrolidone-carboxylate peptidase